VTNTRVTLTCKLTLVSQFFFHFALSASDVVWGLHGVKKILRIDAVKDEQSQTARGHAVTETASGSSVQIYFPVDNGLTRGAFATSDNVFAARLAAGMHARL